MPRPGEQRAGPAPAGVGRRGVLRTLAVAGALVIGAGHTPYRQWVVYRKRHLLILTNRADPPSHPLGTRVAEVLAAELPESRARVARAPSGERIASLISTGQLDVALMRRGEARALLEGTAPLAGYGPVALRALTTLGAFVLVCRDDFPERHGYLVARALAPHRPALLALAPEAAPDAPPPVPLHPGAAAHYAEGG